MADFIGPDSLEVGEMIYSTQLNSTHDVDVDVDVYVYVSRQAKESSFTGALDKRSGICLVMWRVSCLFEMTSPRPKRQAREHRHDNYS